MHRHGLPNPQFPRSGGDFVPPDKAKRTSADVLLLGGGRCREKSKLRAICLPFSTHCEHSKSPRPKNSPPDCFCPVTRWARASESTISPGPAGTSSRRTKQKGHPQMSFCLVGEGGFGPPKSVTTDLQSAPFGRSGIPPYSIAVGKSRWSWWTDLNPRPADYKSAALPAELHQRISHDAHHYITSDSPCQYLFEKFPIFYFFSFWEIIPRISIFLYGKNFIKLLIIPMQCGILLCV